MFFKHINTLPFLFLFAYTRFVLFGRVKSFHKKKIKMYFKRIKTLSFFFLFAYMRFVLFIRVNSFRKKRSLKLHWWPHLHYYSIDCSGVNKSDPGRYRTQADDPVKQAFYFNKPCDNELYNVFISNRIKTETAS